MEMHQLLLRKLFRKTKRRTPTCRLLVEAFEERTLLSFITGTSLAIGSNGAGVAVADFNQDGIPDLVVSKPGVPPDNQGTVTILLGNGDGTFQAPQSVAIGVYPSSVAVGDFNGDGLADLAVTDTTGLLFVLLGKGAGTFQVAGSYPVGAEARAVAVGDLNGDGFADLAVANQTSGTVNVLLGRGDGSFQDAQDDPVGIDPTSVVLGDFNGDGALDLVVTNDAAPSTVTVLLGKGDGTFQAPQSYRAGDNPRVVAVGDFNGDGLPDLAVGNGLNGAVTILLSNGDGSFRSNASYGLSFVANSVALGDFNGDGHTDLAISTSGIVTVFLGNGDGTFQVGHNYLGSGDLATFDANRDGKLDLVTSGGDLLLGNGDGTFHAAESYASGGLLPNSVALGDFDRDGHLDLAVADNAYGFTSGDVSVLLGNGDGSFGAARRYAVGSGDGNENTHVVAVGDFNGDGFLDLAVSSFGAAATNYQGSVSILLGNGDGTFQPATMYAVGSSPSSLAVADFNGDGFLDLVVSNFFTGTVSVLLGKGDGSFRDPQSTAAFSSCASVAVADLNGDRTPDLIVTDRMGNVASLLGKGDGTFQVVAAYSALSPAPASVAVGDVNGDGIPDLAVASFAGFVTIWLGNGDGTFRFTAGYVLSAGAISSIAVSDFNADGHLDLAVTHQRTPQGAVSVLLGKGDGTFQDPQSYAVDLDPTSLTVGDVNGDGFPDLVMAINVVKDPFLNGTVNVLLNAADWGGGPAAVPPRRGVLLGPFPAVALMESVDTLRTLCFRPFPRSLASSDLPLRLMLQGRLEGETGPLATLGVLSVRRLAITTRHTRDALFARKDTEFADALAPNQSETLRTENTTSPQHR